ncbi:MAG: TetR/AcrR family transcriptional regulator [Deltaproteobacteria bacterium]|nr:TetR/AcrR family transcriptional regulator [Nannocystaceae bacterium]
MDRNSGREPPRGKKTVVTGCRHRAVWDSVAAMTLAAVSNSRPRSDLRSRIVDAAWSVGSEGREDTLTIRGIAVRAGVSPALLYTYFENKGALIVEMQQLAMPTLNAALAEAIDGGSDVDEKVARACVAYIEFARGHRWLYEARDASSQSAGNGLTSVFMARLTELLGARGLEAAAADHAAQQLRIAISGLIQVEAQRADAPAGEARAFAQSYVQMLLHGI